MTSKTKKRYFTQETEDAIIEYNKTLDSIKRSQIYNDEIHYPFFKLTQNIIHTFKFYNTEVENIEDLQHELIIFLLSKIHLFNHRKNIQDRLRKIITKEFKEEYHLNFEEYVGEVDKVTQEQIDNFVLSLNVSPLCREKLNKLTPPKAYSYFGTIAKRWLIIYNDKNYNKKINSIPLISVDNNIQESYVLEENNSPSDKLPHNDKLSLFMDLFVDHCTNNIYQLFPKEEEAKIADAVLELFRKRDNLTIFNKKALYIYIKEIIDVKTPKITKVSDKLSAIFKNNYIYYLEYGYIKF
jgi:hypothetical protein